jgi:hypothetical protein
MNPTKAKSEIQETAGDPIDGSGFEGEAAEPAFASEAPAKEDLPE